MAKGAMESALPDSALQGIKTTVQERGILESFFKLPHPEQEMIRQLLEKFTPGRPAAIRLAVPTEPAEAAARHDLLLRVNRLIRYHRLIFESVADAAIRSTYLPWVESITHIKTERGEELELALNSNYEEIWSTLKRSLEKPRVRLKSQYSSRLYRWAKQYVRVGYKRVSLAMFREILGLEEVRDKSGKLVQKAPLRFWASVKQRALDQALEEINERSDIHLELEFTGRGTYRKVQSLGFKITQKTLRKP